MRARLLSLVLLAAPGAAQDVPEALVVDYRCDGGARLQVAYLNPPGGPSLAVVEHGGRMVPMQAGPTGSGVRYVAFDDSGLVWHTKDREGFLARDAGGGQTTLNGNCVEAP
jgi:membrane-bound inhibitor of C-type lysozyme